MLGSASTFACVLFVHACSWWCLAWQDFSRQDVTTAASEVASCEVASCYSVGNIKCLGTHVQGVQSGPSEAKNGAQMYSSNAREMGTKTCELYKCVRFWLAHWWFKILGRRGLVASRPIPGHLSTTGWYWVGHSSKKLDPVNGGQPATKNIWLDVPVMWTICWGTSKLTPTSWYPSVAVPDEADCVHEHNLLGQRHPFEVDGCSRNPEHPAADQRWEEVCRQLVWDFVSTSVHRECPSKDGCATDWGKHKLVRRNLLCNVDHGLGGAHVLDPHEPVPLRCRPPCAKASHNECAIRIDSVAAGHLQARVERRQRCSGSYVAMSASLWPARGVKLSRCGEPTFSLALIDCPEHTAAPMPCTHVGSCL
eukprot:359081-Chlamydomonas_euryale.AAC.9